MTLATAMDRIYQYLDDYSVRGNLNTDHEDLALKINNCLDAAQKEIAINRQINKTYKFTQLLPVNQLTDSFDEVLVEGAEDDDCEYVATGKYYYFEVAGLGVTVTVENSTQEFTHSHNASSYTAYYGSFTASEEITLTFESDYTFSIRNIGVFNTSVTAYAEFMEYNLPTGYLEGVKITSGGKELNKGEDYKIEGDKLYLNSEIYGEVVIVYKAYPTTITSATETSYEFEIDDIAQNAMCFYAAALMVIKSDPSIYDSLFEQYKIAMLQLPINKHPLQKRIKQVE